VPHGERQTGLGSRVILGPQDEVKRCPGPRKGRRSSATLCVGANWPLLRCHPESGFGQVHVEVTFRAQMSGFGESNVESTRSTRSFQQCIWIPSWGSFKGSGGRSDGFQRFIDLRFDRDFLINNARTKRLEIHWALQRSSNLLSESL
jgi:hypothetical protein